MGSQLGLPRQFLVRLSGSDLPDELAGALREVFVEDALSMPSVATISFEDGTARWVDDARLDPGTPVEILASREGNSVTIFDGEIVELEPEFLAAAARMVVRAMDRGHRLTRTRHVRAFRNQTDGDLARLMATEAGLSAELSTEGVRHDYVFQYSETNLSFLQRRARDLGVTMRVQGRKIVLGASADGSDVPELTWGSTLTAFRPRFTALGQVANVTVQGWDPSRRATIESQEAAGGPPDHRVGESRTGASLVSAAFQAEPTRQVLSWPVSTSDEARKLAQAEAKRIADTVLEAEGTTLGDPRIRAGAMVSIAGVGRRFSGRWRVTTAEHRHTPEEGYVTQFSITGSETRTIPSLLQAEEALPPAVAVAIVTENRDPDGRGRVKVYYPWLSAAHGSDWARVVSVGGGPERGIQFIPEIDDEVLVVFERNDLRSPYVLGGLWNGVDAPPLEVNDAVVGQQVVKRALQTRSGHTISFDDSDSDGSIQIRDREGNKVTLWSADNRITIEAQGPVEIKGNGVTIDGAAGGVKVTGGPVEIKGNGVTVDGAAGGVKVTGGTIDLN